MYYISCQSGKKNWYNFDTFTSEWMFGCCHFFYLTIQGKRRGQCPWLKSQVLRVLKILSAHQLKIAVLDHSFWCSCSWIRTYHFISSATFYFFVCLFSFYALIELFILFYFIIYIDLLLIPFKSFSCLLWRNVTLFHM